MQDSEELRAQRGIRHCFDAWLECGLECIKIGAWRAHDVRDEAKIGARAGIEERIDDCNPLLGRGRFEEWLVHGLVEAFHRRLEGGPRRLPLQSLECTDQCRGAI